MNQLNSAPAATSRLIVRSDVQPAWLPFTIAKTASASDVVTVTAPATSGRPAGRAAPVLGSASLARVNAPAPNGTLTRKIQCQFSRSVMTPPSSTPIDPPPAATNPKTPIAFARSAGSVKVVDRKSVV